VGETRAIGTIDRPWAFDHHAAPGISFARGEMLSLDDMLQRKVFVTAFALVMLPFTAGAAPLLLPRLAPQETRGTIKLPTVSPHLGPLKLGVQVLKRPRVDTDNNSVKDMGVGLKLSIGI
jgi:hypothetical protein